MFTETLGNLMNYFTFEALKANQGLELIKYKCFE